MTTTLDNKALVDAIRAAVGESLETMAFADAAPMDLSVASGALVGSAASRAVSIPVISPFTGSVTILYAPDLAVDLASAMYGGGLPEGLDPGAVAQDVMNEFVNTFVGRVIFALDPEASMKIGFPTPVDNAASVKPSSDDAAAAFDVGGKLLIAFCRR